MPSRSDEEQRIWDWIKGAIPSWLATGPQEIQEGLTKLGGVVSDVVWWLFDQTYIALANESFLRMHARNQGTEQRFNESIEALRARLQRPANVISVPALEAEADDILTRYGCPTGATINVLANNKFHWRKPADPADSKGYWSRGDRFVRAGKPQSFVMMLPYGTSDVARDVVTEMLRKHKAMGFRAAVERREVP